MADSRPNIVYIAADQWRGDCLGLYRNRHPVMTPHLNQLAHEGILYSQAYADCPICMPQRVTMLTGQTASQFGCRTNFSARNVPTFDKTRTLPARLAREAGYQTKAVGKMHFWPQRSRYGFEHITLHPDDYLWFLEDNGYGGAFRGHGLGGNELYPATAVTPDRFYHTTWSIDQAIRFLDQRDPEFPFMLYLVFEAPHSPFDPPAPYDRIYDNITINEPIMGDWLEQHCPSMYRYRELGRNAVDLTPDMIHETRRRYYGQITQIDYHLGRLFGALRTRGLDQDTAIVFTSDHGECLGDHGAWAKHCFLQSAARVPLIVRLPRSMPDARRATEHADPVLTADICPTLLGLAGLDPDTDAEGVPLPVTPVGQHDPSRVVCGETPETACAIDSQYKYIYHAAGAVEHLFDIRSDPDDLHNLAGDSDRTDDVARLRAHLIQYLTGNASDLIDNGTFVERDPDFDPDQARASNGLACRGPMRGGMGY